MSLELLKAESESGELSVKEFVEKYSHSFVACHVEVQPLKVGTLVVVEEDAADSEYNLQGLVNMI